MVNLIQLKNLLIVLLAMCIYAHFTGGSDLLDLGLFSEVMTAMAHSCIWLNLLVFPIYFGAAIGKGRQAATTEIEKLKLSEMTCRQGVIEIAKLIYRVHDEAKDKTFEVEMSWVCDESNRLHQKVPEALLEEAKSTTKAALEEVDANKYIFSLIAFIRLFHYKFVIGQIFKFGYHLRL